MTVSPTKRTLMLPAGSDPSRGPGWTDLWIREGTSDEDVLKEIWIMDAYHLRGLDIAVASPEALAAAERRGENTHAMRVTPRIVDVGAYTGIFAALALQMFPACRVIAAEPDPENFDLLTLNALPWRDRTHFHRAAVGPDVGTTMLLGDTGTGHTDRDAPEGGRPVEQIRLADLLDQPAALLKIDIEGGEYDAIAACPSEILARAARIHMEWHGTGEAPWIDDAPRRYGELLAKLSYTHTVQTFGRPDQGGYLFATRY